MSDPDCPTGHTYTVELRLSGEALDPSEITLLLGVPPSNVVLHSDAMRGRRRPVPMWGYNGHDCEGFQPEWSSLDEGLSFIVQRALPLQAKIIELAQRFDGIWWCGHFQTSFDGGPILSPDMLAKLAGFGLPLYVDNYFSDSTK